MEKEFKSVIKEKIVIKNIEVILLLLNILSNKCIIIRLYKELGNAYMATGYKNLNFLWLIVLILFVIITFMDIKFINQKDKNNDDNVNVGEE